MESEAHTRIVRGCEATHARFETGKIPIPRYEPGTVSLYQLQERTDQHERVSG